MFLPDGTVIPYGMDVPDTSSEMVDLLEVNNIMVGEIQEVIYPSSDRSKTKRFIEYNVLAQYRANGIGNQRFFYNVLQLTHFGSISDHSFAVLRADSKAGDTSTKKDEVEFEGIGRGSKVVLACLNSEAASAYIIGCIPDPADKSQKDIKDGELGFHWAYNGIELTVNNDGEATVTYTGKRDSKNKTDVGDDVPGSSITFDKDGGIKISDKDGKNALFVDHKNKKIIISRDSAFELGDATDKMLLGESFRDAQKKLNNDLQAKFKTLQQLASQASTAASTASGKMVTPVYGAVAAAADFVQIAAYMQIMSQTLAQISQSFQSFENSASQKNSFLSKKNAAD